MTTFLDVLLVIVMTGVIGMLVMINGRRLKRVTVKRSNLQDKPNPGGLREQWEANRRRYRRRQNAQKGCFGQSAGQKRYRKWCKDNWIVRDRDGRIIDFRI